MTTEVRKVVLPFDLRTSYDNEPFYKAAHEERKFILPRCRDCGKYYWPAAFVCEHCGSSNVEWVEASGHGKLYSFVETRFAFHKGIKDSLPWVCALWFWTKVPAYLDVCLAMRTLRRCRMTLLSIWCGSPMRRKAPLSWGGSSTD